MLIKLSKFIIAVIITAFILGIILISIKYIHWKNGPALPHYLYPIHELLYESNKHLNSQVDVLGYLVDVADESGRVYQFLVDQPEHANLSFNRLLRNAIVVDSQSGDNPINLDECVGKLVFIKGIFAVDDFGLGYLLKNLHFAAAFENGEMQICDLKIVEEVR